MDNRILLELLEQYQTQDMKINIGNFETFHTMERVLKQYRIRADDRKIKIFGKDKNLTSNAIYIDSALISDFRQDNMLNIKLLQFTYKEKYKVEIKIKKKIEAFGETPISNHTL